MSWLKSGAHRALATIALLYGVMILVVLGLRQSGVHLSLPARLAIALPVAAAAGWLVMRYWRALDEVAREAHKWSWYWGASAGMGLGFVLLNVKAIGLAGYFPPGLSAYQLMSYGGIVVVACQLVCALVAWAIWWLSRR
jgi:hypothetical protein